MVSNSLCEHTGAVIFHNSVQHGYFLCGCSGWQKWNLQRIQDNFPECHFISIITSVSSPKPWPQVTIPKSRALQEGPCASHSSSPSCTQTFPQPQSLLQTFLQCCGKELQGTLCHNARTCTGKGADDAQIAEYSEHQNHRSYRGAGFTQQNKQITSSSSIYCNISLLFLPLSHMEQLL